jgi:hypothetical protein
VESQLVEIAILGVHVVELGDGLDPQRLAIDAALLVDLGHPAAAGVGVVVERSDDARPTVVASVDLEALHSPCICLTHAIANLSA